MQLDGSQQKQLQAALISAFPTRPDLEQMVFHGLSVHLSAITAEGTLSQVVFELLRWAVAQGRLEELIKTALVQKSGNAQLKSVAIQLGVSSSQSSPITTLPSIWNIPYPRNPFFTGQEDVLTQLEQALGAGQAAALSQPQAISGLGGIGKTQIAIEYAYQHALDYQAVLWVLAETRESLVSGYIAIAQLLGLSQKDEQDQAVIVQAVKTWLQTHGSWLFLLDNADELAMVREFVPPIFGGHLLLTTRAQAMGRLAECLEVATMGLDMGALLLVRRAGLIRKTEPLEAASPSDIAVAYEICQELGGLPLALDQAGAYLEETAMNLVSYWQIYQQHRADLLTQRGGLVPDHPASVATTWSLSFQNVEKKNPAAAELLRLCAFLAPDAIAEEILTEGASLLGPLLAPVAASAFRLNHAIEALRAYSFVRRDPSGKTISVHRLVQQVLRDTLSETERRMWVERVVLAVNAVFPQVEHGVWSQCERLLPQALAATQLIERYQITNEETGRLLYETASYLQARVRYAQAEPLYQRAIWIGEQCLGSEHPDVAYPLNGLASLYREQGKYAQAEPLYQRAIWIREQGLGLEHPDVAYPLHNLADLYREQGRYAEAEKCYQRALQLREQSLGSEHPLVAYPLNGLAIILHTHGKYSEAEKCYQRALQLREQSLGSEHPLVSYPLTGLADLCQEQGKSSEAEALNLRALSIREQTLGLAHCEVAYPLVSLASLYSKQGRDMDAEPLYQRALFIWEQALGSEHPYVAGLLSSLANLRREQGRYSEAESIYQRALHIREQQLGLEHPQTMETISDLARLQDVQGNNEDARSFYTRVLSVRSQVFEGHHPKTIEIRTRLIDLLHRMGQHEEATQLEAFESEQ